ncbi:alpha/beta fold hydrolase [Flavitalea sp.]|nr:alpha/beta hydrolase [Flavitalea sp.]
MKKTAILISMILLAQFVISQKAISVAKSGTGSHIIFLPGFTVPGSVWEETIKNLDKSYTSHLVSYAGFDGLKAIDTPWYDAIKKQLADYIRNEKLSNITLIGHSMGGNLGVDIAAEMPDRVAGLIIIESLPCMRELMMPGVPASSVTYNNSYNTRLLVVSPEDFKKMVNGTSAYMTNVTSKVEELNNWSIKADRKTYVYGYTDLLKLDLRDRLSAINTQTLILGASFPDKKVILSNYEKQYSNLKNKEIVIADSSKHFIMFDQPAWLYAQVNNYLNKHAK